MQTKKSNCIICGLETDVKLKVPPNKVICPDCKPLYQRFRNHKCNGLLGKDMTVRKLVLWFKGADKRCAECGSTEKPTLDRIVPNIQGGKYEYGNIQILCYTCNCCKKVDSTSVAKALESVEEKECSICAVSKPLNKNYWHRTGYTAKYRQNCKSMWHPVCKDCRLKQISTDREKTHGVQKNSRWRKTS